MLQILHWIALTLNQSDLLQLSAYMDQIGSVDPWRFFHHNTKDFSYYSTVHQVYSRIDYFFIDKALLSFVNSAQYSAIVISDHAPHILDLCLPSSSHRHQGGWRLNSGLLANADFCDFVSTNIDVFLETNRSDQVSPSLLWETLKAFIRGGFISFSEFDLLSTGKAEYLLRRTRATMSMGIRCTKMVPRMVDAVVRSLVLFMFLFICTVFSNPSIVV